MERGASRAHGGRNTYDHLCGGSVKRSRKEKHILDDLQIASKRLEKAEPSRLGDVSLAPVVQSFRTPFF